MLKPADDQLLVLIDQALTNETAAARLPAGLAQPYLAALDHMYRQPTRVALALFTLIFDVFLISQIKASPELVALSAWLRLGLYTPAVLLFLVLDCGRWRLRRRAYETFLLGLAVAPGVISAIVCVHTTSTNTMSDVRATSLILLVVGLIFRMRLPYVILTAAISCAAYFAGLALTPVIPRAEVPSVILTELSIAAAVIVFSALLDRRDRLVFLLNLREQIRAHTLAQQNRGLRQQIDIDALTGLASRRCFDATLASAWQTAVAAAGPLSLVMIDIDHFKRYNDHYGHQQGDVCLRRVALQARRGVRDGDLIARYGGEEFAVILPDTSLSVALRVAERVRAAVAELDMPHLGVAPGATVSISLGVASIIPDAAATSARLIEMADRHLYVAKRAGRNRVSAADIDFSVQLATS
jgi:diguanylate cyclase (GGDEF)-like protein